MVTLCVNLMVGQPDGMKMEREPEQEPVPRLFVLCIPRTLTLHSKHQQLQVLKKRNIGHLRVHDSWCNPHRWLDILSKWQLTLLLW